MKKNSCLLVLVPIVLLSLPLRLAGQSEYGKESVFSQVRTLEMRKIGSKTYNDIEGLPYYSNSFTESVVYFKDGNYATIPLRLDLLQDEMEFTKDNKTQWLIKKGIGYIRYGNDTIILSSVDSDTSRLSYYFLRDNGEFTLFYRKVVKFYPYVKPQGYVNSVPDRFLPDDDIIYIRKGDAAPVRIITKKNLLSAFEGNEDAIKFIKSKKIKPDDVEALHLLVRYLNKK